ncbi:MAG: ABC transporter permease [Pseudonocardiales bacterium]
MTALPTAGRKTRGGLPLLLSELRWEQVMFWRNPAAAIFTAAFPVMFLVIFGSLNRNSRIGFYGGIGADQYYVPAIISFSMMGACYTALAMQLVNRRETGILKRMRATPMPAWAVIAAQILNALVVGALVGLLVGVIGVVFYGLRVYPSRLPVFVLVLVLGGLSMAALGVLVGSLVPNLDAAPGIVNFIFFPLVFLSGTFYPIKASTPVAQVMQWLPLRPFTLSIFRVFDPRGGPVVNLRDLAVLTAWGIAAALLAGRRFRWEPRR